mgnify:CR=1 FL=1
MWYDETIKNMAFQRDKVLGSCMTEDEEEAKMLNAILDELKLNALVITDPYNMRHVSGFRGGEGALYISAAQKVLITDSRYTEQAGKESDFTVIEECRGHNRHTILKECMEKENVSSDFHMGYEDQSMLCCDFDKLRKELPVQTWIPLGSRIDDLRQVKTEEELEYLARAEEIGDKAFAEFLKIVKPGMTELEAAAELEYLMKKEGAEDLSFNTIIASGLNSSMPHAIPGYKKLEEGDFVTCDFGCKYKGYCSDMTRTFYCKSADPEQTEIHDIVREAVLRAESVIKPGVKFCDIDAQARDYIDEKGYSEYWKIRLGHFIGQEDHEYGDVSPINKNEAEPGMIFSIEPGIYIEGKYGVRIEDLVLVTEDGHELLNSVEKKWRIVG